jgi:uncharacterized membrane protein YdjX (TVP38/TMEM64 family)
MAGRIRHYHTAGWDIPWRSPVRRDARQAQESRGRTDARVRTEVSEKLLAVGLAVIVVAVVVVAISAELLDPQNVRDVILSFGALGPLVFALLYLLAVFLPYGTSVLTIAAGLAYGPAWGALLTLCTSLCISLVPMTVARRLGREWAEEKVGSTRLKKYADMINRNAFLVFFYLRLIPSIPYELQNYIAGVSRISYGQFVLASLLGLGPIILIMTFFGDALTQPGSTQFWIAAGIYGFVLIAPLAYIVAAGKRPGGDGD